jgi:hypothetical protein
MKPRRITEALVYGMLLIGLGRVLAACIPLSQAAVTTDVQQEIERGVAATLGAQAEIQAAVSATVEAFVSAGLPQAGSQVTVQAAAPTSTPTPTSAPASTEPPPQPTNTPLPTVAQTAAHPEIVANANTNCRQGPGTNYLVDGYLMAGASSEVYGRTTNYGWWYIKNPTAKSEYCWVWGGSTEVDGEVSTVPVVATSASPVSSSSYSGYYGYGYYSNACCTYANKLPKNLWQKFCKKNKYYCGGYITCECKLNYNPCKKNNCNPYWDCGGCWSGCPYPYPYLYPNPDPNTCYGKGCPEPIDCYDVCDGDSQCLNLCKSGNIKIRSQ